MLENDVAKLKQCAEKDESLYDDVFELQQHHNFMEQEQHNDKIIIRGLPLHLNSNRDEMKMCARKIIDALDATVAETQYDVYSFKAPKGSLASLQMTFETSMLKMRLLTKYREMKKDKSADCPFLVEKFTQLPIDDSLNGKSISISNKLSAHTLNLLDEARKYVKSGKFKYCYDTPSCQIIAMGADDKKYRLSDENDINAALKSIGKKKVTQKSNQSESGAGTSNRALRSNRKIDNTQNLN